MNKLLIVSNRLPVTVKTERGDVVVSKSAGGLATGLSGPHQQMDSLWIGWPGDVSRLESSQRSRLETQLSNLRTAPVYLTQSETSRYYEGFSNSVLWPLFHYMTDRVEREAWRTWKTYSEVNRRFAEVVARHYKPGDMVWVHDYQLALVPSMLRELIPEARIGFFLHIPFPSSEVFRILPWRAEILEGIIGADLIGFHAYSYLRHFKQAVLHILGYEAEGDFVACPGREVRLGAFPMGIDARGFDGLSQDQEVLAQVSSIRERCGDRKLLVGVDRLDYTKGLPRRMLAVERLLEREPALRRKIRFVQIVVPSRTRVQSYETYRRHLDEIVGRINAAYATVNAVPIHYLYRSIPQTELVALYRAADVMLVTPLRDGMNLVAKEFVASRSDEDGVLVLSEFAGAASELAEALQVNPYDLDGVASAIKTALLMPEDERRTRIRALRRRVMAYDAVRWATTFLRELGATKQSDGPPPAMSSRDDLGRVRDAIRSAKRALLLLDYDGTLVPFASAPELAAPDGELLDLLRRLAELDGISVHVVSGRTRQTLDRWLGALPVDLHAEHGYWSRTASGPWRQIREETMEWKPQATAILERFTDSTAGSSVEDKSAGVAWHYRKTDPVLGTSRARELNSALSDELREWPIEVLSGDKVVEVRPRGINKGAIVSRLLADNPDRLVMAMGDDRTDEDMFAALPPDSFAIHVGPGPTIARFRVLSPAAARSFLESLMDTQKPTHIAGVSGR